MSENSIPRTIHCCWFGGAPLPRLARKCIASWQRVLPEYEIVIWTEDNYDVNSTKYTRQAYQAGKHAFVSDYARFDIIAKSGGVYLDLDVEVLRPLDRFLSHAAFLAFEHGPWVAPGLVLGAVPSHPTVEGMREMYRDRAFLLPDGTMDVTTIVSLTTGYLQARGLRLVDEYQILGDVAIYPTEYFCPTDRSTGETVITSRTYAIHHYAQSWLSRRDRMKSTVMRTLGPRATGHLVNLKQAVGRGTIR